MPLHPKLRERIDYEESAYPDITQVPVEEGRRIVREIATETDRLAGLPPPLERVEDHSVLLPGHVVGVRLYFPSGGRVPAPVVAFLHGGGWVFGDVETHDSMCREIAARSQSVVASVAYRRSPENKFPDALDDCNGVIRWLADPTTAKRFGLRSESIAVAGTSAGGNMAAVLASQSRAPGSPRLVGQILIYPVTAHFPETASYRDNAHGFGLEAEFMAWMWEQYLRSPEDGADARVAPLREVNLARSPPAHVLTAEYDLLRDEGEEYARRLDRAGVHTRISRYQGMIHGFLDYRGIVKEGWDALSDIADTLRYWFGTADAEPRVTS